MKESQISMLKKWRARFKRAQIAHNDTSVFYYGLHIWVGVFLVLLTSGAAVITFWRPPTELSWIPVAVSIIATLVAALQTFMNFSEHSEIHRASARRYGEIKKEIEFILEFGEKMENVADKIDVVREKEITIGQDSPNTKKKIWERAKAQTSDENEKHSIRNRE